MVRVGENRMTNIATRERWRDHSIISSAVKATIQGLGWRSYTASLDGLIDLVREIKEAARAQRSEPSKPKGRAKR